MIGMEGRKRSCRVMLTTFGSLGDLHPYIAIALKLKERGHEPVVATMDLFRAKVEEAGLTFRSIRALRGERPDQELMKRVMDQRTGGEFIVRNLLMPALRDAYEDTAAAAEDADILVAHPMSLATQLVAEVRGIPWVSTQLAPMGFFSPFDPPVLASAPLLSKLRFLGPTLHRPLFRLLKWTIRSWSEPYRRMRSELGLPPAPEPLIGGMHSPRLVLALFSKLLGAEQPDWPPHTVVTGFPFYDQDGDTGLDPALSRFLEDGPPPIVFTLGTSAVMDAGQFYQDSAVAARRLGRRAVLLVGQEPSNRPTSLPEGIVAFDYSPFSELFLRAAAIVHQGGVGTTGQAMRSGRPMLVMPYAHDQPDNAERVRRLGIARTVPRNLYDADRAVHELNTLLSDPGYSERATWVGERVQQEDGVVAACDALESLLDTVVGQHRKRISGPPLVLD